MSNRDDVVITGLGCVTALGIGREEFWSSLNAGQCAIKPVEGPPGSQVTHYSGAPICGFDAKAHVVPRKSLKVMSRSVQLAFAAARLAWQDASFADSSLDQKRVGVVCGTEASIGDMEDLFAATQAAIIEQEFDHKLWGNVGLREIAPLWMLKYLPNMPACHVAIAVDAQGPNNSIVQEEVSGLVALQEAVAIIERGTADVMIVGAVGEQVHPSRLVYRHQAMYAPATLGDVNVARPFDARRCGIVPGEGAAAIIVENHAHARRRGAHIWGRVRGCGNAFGTPQVHLSGSDEAIALAIRTALLDAGISPSQIDHVAGQGFSERRLDQTEASAIQRTLGNVPVTTAAGNIGLVGAASGMVELLRSLLCLQHKTRLPIMGFEFPDPTCPINVVREIESTSNARSAMIVSFTPHGQAAAVAIECTT